MTKPMISVIVPVYNAEKFLSRCIESIITQTYKNLEILLVNDGSTDNSGTICESYRLKDDRIKVFHIKNGGVSRARNYGFSNAKGEYVGFVDSDDWIDARMYENLFNYLVNFNADLGVCDVYYEYQDKTFVNKRMFPTETLLNKAELYKAILEEDYFYGYTCNKLFKKSLLGKIDNKKIFREELHYCEDLLLVAQYISKSNSAVYTPSPYYHYSQTEESATSQKNFNPKILSLIDAYVKLIELYSIESREQLNILKMNYTKINMNIKYRVLASEGDPSILEALDENIKRYLKDIKEAKDISISQKVNVLGSLLFPKISGCIKTLLKKYLFITK